jgi:hypothetical protein
MLVSAKAYKDFFEPLNVLMDVPWPLIIASSTMPVGFGTWLYQLEKSTFQKIDNLLDFKQVIRNLELKQGDSSVIELQRAYTAFVDGLKADWFTLRPAVWFGIPALREPRGLSRYGCRYDLPHVWIAGAPFTARPARTNVRVHGVHLTGM